MVAFELPNLNNQEMRGFFRQAPTMSIGSRLQNFHRLFPYAEHLPALVWLNAADSTTVACNQLSLQSLKADINELNGCTIFDTAERMNFPREMAEKIEQNNIRALNGETVIAREKTLDGLYEQIWLSRKQPVIEENNRVVGFLGVSILVEEIHRRIIWNEAQSQYILYLTPENFISLSVREFEVLKEILNGRTPAEIAVAKNVSPKTIESYLNRVKIKCGCSKNREVISYFIRTDLANEIFSFSPSNYSR